MSAEIHFDFSSIQSILIIGLVAIVGAYLYYEIHKIKIQIDRIDLLIDQSRDTNNIKLQNEQNEQNKQNIQNIHFSDGPVTEQAFEDNQSDRDGPDQNIASNEWNEVHHLMNNFETNNIPDISDDLPDDKPDNINDINDTRDTPDDILNIKLSEEEDINGFLSEEVSEEIDDIMDDIMNQHDTKIIEPDYSKMTVSELKKILTDKNLTVSGNKTKLIERIKENL